MIAKQERAKQERRRQRRLAEKAAEAPAAVEATAAEAAAAGESTPDVPPPENVDTHSGVIINVSWVQQGASVQCAWRKRDGIRATWFAATIVSLNADGTVRVKFTASGSFSDGVGRGDLRKVAEADGGTNLLAEFDGKVATAAAAVTAEAAAAAADALTAEAAPAAADGVTAQAAVTEAEAAAAEAAAAKPRVLFHVCCQPVHATGSQGPWCVSCQGQVHSEECCNQVVWKEGANELACKSCVQFRPGEGP
jgi:hypothetical protein